MSTTATSPGSRRCPTPTSGPCSGTTSSCGSTGAGWPTRPSSLTSSGQTGLFSMGVTSRSERRAQERTLDLALRQLGASEESPTLVLNCLPMGISIPTRLATVATPSVHLEMALELLDRAGSGFDRVVIAAEPLFLKEMGETALREKGPGFADRVVACFVGGEWVAECWRRYVSGLFGFARVRRPAGGVWCRWAPPRSACTCCTRRPPCARPAGPWTARSRAGRCSDAIPATRPPSSPGTRTASTWRSDGTPTGSAHWSSPHSPGGSCRWSATTSTTRPSSSTPRPRTES